ncbi:inhibitor of apoptosis-promoting Bax1 protein [Ceratobasidium sp. AG-Ba]|nr:inhibitor of apoptosis-promoting Bax1 protein [Ceratobasidium sp. AG-Ba]
MSKNSQRYPNYGASNSSNPFINAQHDSSRGVNGSDLPDDFKYGVTVSESVPPIRQKFVRRVYFILIVQLLGTDLVGWLASYLFPVAWVQSHQWLIFVALLAALVNLGLLYWKHD